VELLRTLPGWHWRRAGWTAKRIELLGWIASRSRGLPEGVHAYPSKYATDVQEKRLGKWLDNQMQALAGSKRSKLTEAQEQALSELPGWEERCNLNDFPWDMQMHRLREWVDDDDNKQLPHRILRRTTSYEDSLQTQFGDWFRKQCNMLEEWLKPRMRLRVKQAPKRRMPDGRARQLVAVLQKWRQQHPRAWVPAFVPQ